MTHVLLFLTGSASRWSSLFRFKHLTSGSYLAVDVDDRPDLNDDEAHSSNNNNNNNNYALTCVSTLDERTAPMVVFELDKTSIATSNGNLIPYNSFVRLRHKQTSTWLHCTSLAIDTAEEKPTMWRIACSKLKEDKEAFQIIPVSFSAVRDLDFANDSARMLATYVERLVANQLTANDRRALCSLLASLIFFTAQYEQAGHIPPTLGDVQQQQQQQQQQHQHEPKQTSRERQKLMREQNILHEVFRLLKAPFKSNADASSTMTTLAAELKDNKNGLQPIFRLAYRLLKHSQHSYRKNQVCAFSNHHHHHHHHHHHS